MTRAPSKTSHSLVNRLLIAQVVPLTVFAIVLLGVGAWTAHRVVERTSDRLLAGAMQTILQSVSLDDQGVTVDVAPWSLALLDTPERDAVFYGIREGERMVTGYHELPTLKAANTERPVFANLTVRGVPVRMAQQTVMIPGRTAPVVVSVAQSLDSRRASLHELYGSLLLLPGLLVVLAALLIWPALQWGLNSLRRLVDELAARSSSSTTDFAPAAVTLAPRELTPVLTAFNALLAGLERSTSGMQRFAADASHQLRTPLAVMAANLDLLAASKRPWTRTEQRLLTDSQSAAASMTHLINQLLSTARADTAHSDATADLGRAVRKAYQVFADRHPLTPGALRLRLPLETVEVRGSQDLIVEQLLNLIDNGFRHGAAPVIVHVSNSPEGAAVTVWDHGEGVDDAVLPSLTERFFRSNPNRSTGSGLGLAIVEALSTAQSGQLRLASRGPGKGLVAQIIFGSIHPPIYDGDPR